MVQHTKRHSRAGFPLASGKGEHSAIKIRQKDATLWVGRLLPGEEIKIPDSPYAHLYVAKGAGE